MENLSQKLKDKLTKRLIDELIDRHSLLDRYVDFYPLMHEMEGYILSTAYHNAAKITARAADSLMIKNRTTLVMKLKKHRI